MSRDACVPLVLLVGESNPYSRVEDHALLPYPVNASGDRLRRILGMDEDEYLRAFVRRNLLVGPSAERWGIVRARYRAQELLAQFKPNAVVALGRRVVGALADVLDVPVPSAFYQVVAHQSAVESDVGRVRLLALPHPSRRSRVWNELAIARARAVVRELIDHERAQLG